MTIARLQPTPTTAAPKRPSAIAPATAPAAAKPAASADALSLSAGTENAEARALFAKGQALDAQGFTTPANDVFKKAIKAATSVDTLLAIRAIAARNDNGAYSQIGQHSVWRESLVKADQLAAKLPVATGANPVRAYVAQAEKWQAQELDHAASVNYGRAIDASQSLAQVLTVQRSMLKSEDAIQEDLDYPFHDADKKAKALAEELPAATDTVEATAQADRAYRAGMPLAARVLYQRALASADTLEKAYAVQKSVEGLEDSDAYPHYDQNNCGVSGCHDLEFLRRESNGRVWRLEHPVKAWNPLTWLPNKSS